MKKGTWLTAGIFLLLTVVFCSKLISTSQMLAGSDYVLQGQYFSAAAEDSLKQGQLPFWLPNIKSGMPNISSINTAFFYPTIILSYLLRIPPHLIFNYDFLLHVFLAGFFMFLFARAIGTSVYGGIFAGVVFMFSGSFFSLANAGHVNHVESTALIPLIFYCFEKGYRKKSLFYFLASGAVLGLQNLSTGFQIMLYTAICLGLYFLYKIIIDLESGTDRKAVVKTTSLFISGLIMTLIFSAILFVPAFIYRQDSIREAATYEFFTSWSYHPSELISYLLPQFFGMNGPVEYGMSTIPPAYLYWGHNPFSLTSDYIGILPLVIFVLTLFFIRQDSRITVFSGMGFMSLILSFGGYTPLYKLLYHVPFLSGFRAPGRWLTFFAFMASILAGIGFDLLGKGQEAKKEHMDKKKRISQPKISGQPAWHKKFRYGMLVLTALFLLCWIIVSTDRTEIVNALSGADLLKGRFQSQDLSMRINLIYDLIVQDFLRLAIFTGLCAGLVFFSLGKNVKTLTLLAGCLAIFLPDIWISDARFLPLGPPDQYGQNNREVISFLKQDPELFRVYPLGSLGSENWYTVHGLYSAGGYHGLPLKRYSEVFEKVKNNQLALLSMLNVKYFISAEAINLDPGTFSLVFDKRLKIYMNRYYLPRAWLVGDAVSAKSTEEVFRMIDQPGFNPTRQAVLEDPLPAELDKKAGFTGKEAKITHYTNNRIELEVESPSRSLLVLSEMFYREWKAEVDNRPVRIYPANGILRSVFLEPGKHHVVFYYDPKYFTIGTLVTAFGLVLLILAGCLHFRTSRIKVT